MTQPEPEYLSMEYEVPGLFQRYLKKKPKHIVLIFLESFGDWVTKIEVEDFKHKITPNFTALREQSMEFLEYFPAGALTMENLTKATLGIPLPRNFPYEYNFSAALNPFPDTMPKAMNRKGYKPHFFYGGPLTWHHLYYYFSKWNYEQVYGENNVSKSDTGWFSAYDENLYEFLHQHLESSSIPTFNFVLTISNHPPYRVPESFQFQTPPAVEQALPPTDNPDYIQRRFKTIAYADKALGEFFEKARASGYFDETLFIVTGDHAIQGGFRWPPEERYHTSRIPLLVYAPNLLKQPQLKITHRGTHLDMLPTLLSMLNEEPVRIRSWGRTMLEPSTDEFLNSPWIDCLSDICLYHEQLYRVDPATDRMKACFDEACVQSGQLLRDEILSWGRSGLHYFFQFKKDDAKEAFPDFSTHN
ncbi:MAG: LTA synthase family protein [SAR324 cluster bacterium]|nr:LTA synthase family protein [SAR324 cluster bacterium]